MSTAEAVYFSEPYDDRLLALAEGGIGGVNEGKLSAEQLSVQLQERKLFGEQLLAQLHDRKFAVSSMQPGEEIPYVRIGERSGRPALYVPGFTEGIEAKAPFALEIAKRGREIILPGQNRTEILKDAVTGAADATYSQARNYIDVLRAEGLADKPGSVDIITHSYGSLIFEAMHKIAAEENLPCFEGAKVAMLAPAGLNNRENLAKLVGRFAWGMGAENFTKKDFPDQKREMLKAGTANMFANVPRSVRETLEMATRRVDFERLLRSEIGLLAVLGYAKDGVFPDRVLSNTRDAMFALDGLSAEFLWSTPVSVQPVNGDFGVIRGGRDASHNDEQFNPSRVAGAVAQLLAA